VADQELPQGGAAQVLSPEALVEKYRIEREKRLRADGLNQYIDLGKTHTEYADDPSVDPNFAREAIDEEFDVLVVGAGFSGMLAAAHMRMAGVENFRVIDKAGDFGGTWYWNKYPGAACDIESYIYMPLLEETGYMPTEKYAKGPEIFAHCQRIARHYDLYRAAIFQTSVTDARWDAERQRWLVITDRGDHLRPRFLVLAGGILHKPKLPDLLGLDSFKGHTFHTSRWDYHYTGGDSNGGLTGLADKRVAVIGTGASAIQVVPHLGRWAKQLYVFQRTPSSVDFRNNHPTDPEWAKTLKPGWQRERMVNFNRIVTGVVEAEDLVNDGWTILYHDLQHMPPELAADSAKVGEYVTLCDNNKMNDLRLRIETVIKDKGTAEALKPWYMRHCKRPCYHDDYLDTFNRPNVKLVNTDGRGVERLTEKGLVAGGVEYEVDCIIFATGFEFGQEYTRRLGFDCEGEKGLKLSEKMREIWGTLHGMTSRGFPNLMLIGASQAIGTTNFPHGLGELARHAAYIASTALARGAKVVEPSEAAEDAWVETILGYENFLIKTFKECTPNYFNNEGTIKLTAATARHGGYGAGVDAFVKLIEAWRAAGDLAGLEVRTDGP
jgi:cyclohexanone monooxygenase